MAGDSGDSVAVRGGGDHSLLGDPRACDGWLTGRLGEGCEGGTTVGTLAALLATSSMKLWWSAYIRSKPVDAPTAGDVAEAPAGEAWNRKEGSTFCRVGAVLTWTVSGLPSSA